MKTHRQNGAPGRGRPWNRLFLTTAVILLLLAVVAPLAQAKTRPSGTMAINGGAPFTNVTAVTIGSSMSGVTKMRFLNVGGSWTSWESYSSSKVWTLPVGDGLKTVQAQYKSVGQAISKSATITLDTTGPTTTDNSDGLWHPGFTLELTPADAASGVASTEFRVNGGPWVDGTSVSLRVLRRHRRGGYAEGANMVEYRSTDVLGNTGAIVTATVLLDDRPPVTTSDAPVGPQAGDVTVHLTAVDDLSGSAHTYYELDGGDWLEGGDVTVAAPADHGNDGLHGIWYFSVDTAGNVSSVSSCTVTIATP